MKKIRIPYVYDNAVARREKKNRNTNKEEKKKVIFFEKNLHSHSIPFVIMCQAVMLQFLFLPFSFPILKGTEFVKKREFLNFMSFCVRMRINMKF